MSQSDCPPVAGWTFRGAALALAVLLFGVQGYTIWADTDAALPARLYAVSAIAAIAFLPIAFESARRTGGWGLAAFVALAGLALFLYSLPGTLTRAGELREKDALAGSTYANAQKAYDQASEALNTCTRERKRDCTLAERDVDRKRTDLKIANKGGNIVGDVGARIITHWLPVSEATVRAVSSLAYAIGAEIAIAALMAVVVRGAPRPQAPDQPQPSPPPVAPAQARKKKRKPVIEVWIRGHLAQHEETSLADAYACYMEARTGGRKLSEEKFGKAFQAEAKRQGRTLRREGKRTLYVVAAA
jgi:hypothetical protein